MIGFEALICLRFLLLSLPLPSGSAGRRPSHLPRKRGRNYNIQFLPRLRGRWHQGRLRPQMTEGGSRLCRKWPSIKQITLLYMIGTAEKVEWYW